MKKILRLHVLIRENEMSIFSYLLKPTVVKSNSWVSCLVYNPWITLVLS